MSYFDGNQTTRTTFETSSLHSTIFRCFASKTALLWKSKSRFRSRRRTACGVPMHSSRKSVRCTRAPIVPNLPTRAFLWMEKNTMPTDLFFKPEQSNCFNGPMTGNHQPIEIPGIKGTIFLGRSRSFSLYTLKSPPLTDIEATLEILVAADKLDCQEPNRNSAQNGKRCRSFSRSRTLPKKCGSGPIVISPRTSRGSGHAQDCPPPPGTLRDDC